MALPSMLVWAVSSPAMAYVYYGVMKLPSGWTRLTVALPLIAFYVSVATGFATVFERGIYSFFFVWLTSFKIVLLCWDDGPAADPWAVASFPRFLAVMNLSLQIKRQKFSDRAIKSKKKKTLTAANPNTNTPDVIHNGDKESRRTTNHGSDIDTSLIRTTNHGSEDIDTNLTSHGSDIDPSLASNGSDMDTSLTSHGSDIDRSLASHGGISKADEVEQSWIVRVDQSQEMPAVVLRLLFKFVCIMVMTYVNTFTPNRLLPVLYSFYIYIACSLIFEGIAAVVSPLMGIELEPCFNKPFLAHSLADFWGKRWNLLVSNLLRVSIYDPVLRFLLQWSERLGSSAAPSPRLDSASTPSAGPTTTTTSALSSALPLWARSISMFSCFLVSGLMHELIFHNMTRRKPSWEVTFYFVLNGAATILEGALRRTIGLRLPKYVSSPLTLAFVLVTAIWFFFPPLIDTGTADSALSEFQYFFNNLYHLIRAS